MGYNGGRLMIIREDKFLVIIGEFDECSEH